MTSVEATVPLGSDGVVEVLNAAGQTQVLLDVVGYYSDQTSVGGNA